SRACSSENDSSTPSAASSTASSPSEVSASRQRSGNCAPIVPSLRQPPASERRKVCSRWSGTTLRGWRLLSPACVFPSPSASAASFMTSPLPCLPQYLLVILALSLYTPRTLRYIPLSPQRIAHAAHRLDQPWRIVAQLLPQVAHEDLKHVVVTWVVVAPDARQNRIAREHLARMHQEQL